MSGLGLLTGTIVFLALGCIGAFSTTLWAKSQVELARVLCFLGAFCCWLSWILVYMAQMNPLLLPTRDIKME